MELGRLQCPIFPTADSNKCQDSSEFLIIQSLKCRTHTETTYGKTNTLCITKFKQDGVANSAGQEICTVVFIGTMASGLLKPKPFTSVND